MGKGIGEWLRRRDGWDLASAALMLLFLALILVNISIYPVFLDIPYHMAVTQGFREAGGVTTWDFWDYAPEGRPHLYPPLLHVGMSLLQDLGLSQQAVATLVCLVMFPLIVLALWWMMRRLFGPRAAFFSLLFLCVSYAFFWQTGITVAASLVLALTPLLFLALEKDRRLAAGLLLAMCLYAHLVLGHLAALALVIYLVHRRRYWKRILATLALAYLLYLPWGLVVITNLSSLHFSEPGGGGNLVVHLLTWLAALAGAVVCYRKKGRYYLLPSYLLSMVPIAFFYPNRFWEGHVFLPLAMLGAVALDRLCEALRGALDRRGVAHATSRAVVAVLAAGMALLLLMVDPVLTTRGAGGERARAGVPPGSPPTGQVGMRPPLGQPGPSLGRSLSPNGSPQPPFGDLEGTAVVRPQDRTRFLRVAKDGSLRLALEPTSLLVLAGLEEAGKQPAGDQEVFGKESEALMLAVRENSRPGEVVFVLDGRLGDLIYAMTGRYATRGMFHEVQPEEDVNSLESLANPLEGLADAALAIVGGVGGPRQGYLLKGDARRGKGLGVDTPPVSDPGGNAMRMNAFPGTLRGWKVVAEEGRYLVLAKEGNGGSEGRPCDAALPLGVAYAILALAVAICSWDFMRRGPFFRRSGADTDSNGSPPGTGGEGGFLPQDAAKRAGTKHRKGEGGDNYGEKGGEGLASGARVGEGINGGDRVVRTADSLSLFGEAWLKGPRVGCVGGKRYDGEASCDDGAVLQETLLLVPAYNEAANVGLLVNEIKWTYPEVDVLVLDDGSWDGTSAKAYAAGAAVLRSSRNRGIGEMMRCGLSYALHGGYRYAVRLDGDGQHPPAEITALLGPIARGEAEVAIGSRFLGGDGGNGGAGTSLSRRVGMAYFRLVLRITTRRAFSDPTSGFQAYSREAMRFLADSRSRRYPETFWLMLLSRAGYHVSEVAVQMRPRCHGRSSIGPREALSMTAGATACLLRHPGREVPEAALFQSYNIRA